MAYTWSLELFDPITNDNILSSSSTRGPEIYPQTTSSSTVDYHLTSIPRIHEQPKLLPVEGQPLSQEVVHPQFADHELTNTISQWDQDVSNIHDRSDHRLTAEIEARTARIMDHHRMPNHYSTLPS